MQTRAERRGDRWILNGRKTWITAGPVADLFLCFASTDPSKGVLGISAFLIERDTPGFRVVREIPKLGMRTVPMGELAFEDCVLPARRLLGREGRGASIFNAAMELERGAILAGALGTMRRQLERCIEHARTRKQFGQPIGKFQSVSNRIVDMASGWRRAGCWSIVMPGSRSHGAGRRRWASMAKLHVSECFVQNSLDAVRLFGAAGYAEETGIERDLRDSVGSLIFSGTNDIQRNIIAQHSAAGLNSQLFLVRRFVCSFAGLRSADLVDDLMTGTRSRRQRSWTKTTGHRTSLLQGPGVGAGRGHPRRAGADLLPGPRARVLPGVQPPDAVPPGRPLRRAGRRRGAGHHRRRDRPSTGAVVALSSVVSAKLLTEWLRHGRDRGGPRRRSGSSSLAIGTHPAAWAWRSACSTRS